MEILKKKQFDDNITKYYEEHFGKRDSDVWFEPPAVNVRVFRRNGKFISLKSHILTGEVEVFIE